MPENQDEPFLLRWSRRKRGDGADDGATHSASSPGGPDAAAADDAATVETDKAPASHTAAAEQPVPEDLADVDVTTLDYSSDFERFMRDDVPEALRRQALRQLWRSDPILANLDGLCDYDDDFTDAALAVKVLETAHKVGRGFLDDDDLDEADEAAEGETNAGADAENVNADAAEAGPLADVDDAAVEPDQDAAAAPSAGPKSDATDPAAQSGDKDQSAV
ncbi:MAG: DUF3306 domain-containing protein [Hyphomicrobiaceae bacterium]|nr:DUF3306 domain-containing protein [Hyphomicrobiaceae bacterium]